MSPKLAPRVELSETAAIAQGLKRYRGAPCAMCFGDQRYVRSNKCCGCALSQVRLSRAAQRERAPFLDSRPTSSVFVGSAAPLNRPKRRFEPSDFIQAPSRAQLMGRR